MDIAFATGNKGKITEAKKILECFKVHIIQKDIKLIEPRSNSLEKIATEKAKQACEILKNPVIVEDSGLFIESLNDFPGTYSHLVYNKISDVGILKLMDGLEDRSAVFKAVVAFTGPKRNPITFTGEQKGIIAFEVKGSGGFGFDPIFIPKSEKQTWAENPQLKAKRSHRKIALEKFANWAKDNL
ncbi:MAG: XTP/dITP diphosphatase [Candidatus Aenigmarchaeota archaeon]|nr:XTP/dITP diphosphatase [Candidatus Aenigmarchaeota archaeon]